MQIIDRCVCFNKKFSELKEFCKDAKNSSELKEIAKCCTKCRLCTPYIEAMIKTGKTVFILGKFN